MVKLNKNQKLNLNESILKTNTNFQFSMSDIKTQAEKAQSDSANPLKMEEAAYRELLWKNYNETQGKGNRIIYKNYKNSTPLPLPLLKKKKKRRIPMKEKRRRFHSALFFRKRKEKFDVRNLHLKKSKEFRAW